MSHKLAIQRLIKEQTSLEKEPLSNALVARDGHLNFHFCLYNLEGAYEGGYYHGVLELPEDYPFSAPKLQFYTPNGRFDTHTYICTTFTHYHQNTWTSAWNVRTLIIATISFMYSEEGGIGQRIDSEDQRKAYACNSMTNNKLNQKFIQLFGEKLVKIGKLCNKDIGRQQSIYEVDLSEEKKEEPQETEIGLGDNQISVRGEQEKALQPAQGRVWKPLLYALVLAFVLVVCGLI